MLKGFNNSLLDKYGIIIVLFYLNDYVFIFY